MKRHSINNLEQQWFIYGQECPYTYQQMLDEYYKGHINKSTYVACAGMKQWATLGELPLANDCEKYAQQKNFIENYKHKSSTESFPEGFKKFLEIGCFTVVLIAIFLCIKSEREYDNATTEYSRSTVASSTSNENKDITIGINEEFSNKTIKGMITSVNLDYKEYSNWTEIPDGYKAIYIQIKVTNISNSDNYVSVGDFDCYIDNIATDADMLSCDNYNENIAPSRSAILGAVYIIPSNAQSIELEYDPLGESAQRTIIKIQ